MIKKPDSITPIGIVQFFLASTFVIWLLFFPDTGKDFAWPITPKLTAMFIGVSFILRAFLGYHLWREKSWPRLRWIVWGNYMFLGILFLATFWHLEQMNWKPNIIVAHIWVIAYIVEPLTLVLVEPRGAEMKAALPVEAAQGPVMIGLRRTLALIYVVGITIAGILFINPAFADTRWPWALDPFNARVMAAWPAACAVWAATMYFCKDWAEIKIGVQALMIYAIGLTGLWLVTFPQFELSRKNGITFGVATAVISALLIYYYWRQEAAYRKVHKSFSSLQGGPDSLASSDQ